MSLVSLIKNSPFKQYQPKKIKFSGVYQYQRQKPMSETVKKQIHGALRQAGYSNNKISEIISQDKLLPVAEIKKAAAEISHAANVSVADFSGEKGELIVKKYVRAEAVKQKNLAGVRKERMLEALKENLNGKQKTPPNARDFLSSGLGMGPGGPASLAGSAGSAAPKPSIPRVKLPF